MYFKLTILLTSFIVANYNVLGEAQDEALQETLKPALMHYQVKPKHSLSSDSAEDEVLAEAYKLLLSYYSVPRGRGLNELNIASFIGPKHFATVKDYFSTNLVPPQYQNNIDFKLFKKIMESCGLLDMISSALENSKK
ncbi:uncharacterized protein LOC126844375 [Adelges cooleyi]|uniref:uncharacterized protein LOC126844375 n=1 Tax=Adelges cooleyi TaxID=133065 RepID=UPI00217F3DCC|nr:uncharacterized protein LOC126844375 [Adelges cooleyi]